MATPIPDRSVRCFDGLRPRMATGKSTGADRPPAAEVDPGRCSRVLLRATRLIMGMQACMSDHGVRNVSRRFLSRRLLAFLTRRAERPSVHRNRRRPDRPCPDPFHPPVIGTLAAFGAGTLTPCFRQSSAALRPAWFSFRMPMICSSLSGEQVPCRQARGPSSVLSFSPNLS
jgi:hypothetical protein